MDLLIVAIIVASVVLAYVLLRGGDRYWPTARENQSPGSFGSGQRSSAFPASGIEGDSKTHFVETPKRRSYRLLNDAEQILYFRLCEAMPNMQIFAQVGVAQLAQLRGRQEARRMNTMAGRGVDFVVCNPDFAIVAAIDLAWPTANEKENSPEEEKRRALQSLGIPLIVYRPNNLPDASTLSKEVATAIIYRKRLEAVRTSPS